MGGHTRSAASSGQGDGRKISVAVGTVLVRFPTPVWSFTALGGLGCFRARPTTVLAHAGAAFAICLGVHYVAKTLLPGRRWLSA